MVALGAVSRELVRRGVRLGLDHVMRELASLPSFYRLIDQVVQHLVRHPDVRDLIHEQSTDMLDDAVRDVRIEAARADTAVDRAVFAFRQRLRPKRRR